MKFWICRHKTEYDRIQSAIRLHSPCNSVEFSASEMHIAVLNNVDTPIENHKKVTNSGNNIMECTTVSSLWHKSALIWKKWSGLFTRQLPYSIYQHVWSGWRNPKESFQHPTGSKSLLIVPPSVGNTKLNWACLPIFWICFCSWYLSSHSGNLRVRFPVITCEPEVIPARRWNIYRWIKLFICGTSEQCAP
jgi:hypothetical protein